MENLDLILFILGILAIILYFWGKHLRGSSRTVDNIVKTTYRGFTIYRNQYTDYTRIFDPEGKLIRSTFLVDDQIVRTYIDRYIKYR